MSLGIAIFGFVSMASLAPALANEEKKEEKKEEGKSEGAKGEKGGEKKPEGADREWAKRTSKLNVLEAKLKEIQKGMAENIKAKNSEGERGGEESTKRIAEAQKELTKTYEEYLKAKNELKYRFPEEGALIERRYVPLREKSLEQVEKEMGLHGDLTRIKLAIEKKYGSVSGEKAPPPPKHGGEPEATLKEIHHQKSPKSSEESEEPGGEDSSKRIHFRQ